MSKKKKTKFKFNSVNLLEFAWDQKIKLGIVFFLSAIISLIISLQITELFKSSVVLFPQPSISVSKYLMSDQYVGQQGLLSFGEDEETEQLLQILNSDQIRDRIIAKYNLMDHYEIDSTHKYKKTILFKKYKKYIKFKRTKYRSVIIEVLDKNPDTASLIANDIAALIDTTFNNIVKKRAQLAFQTVKQEYVNLQNEINALEDSLKILRRLGIFDYEAQIEYLTQGYASAITENKEDAIKTFEQKFRNLARYGGGYASISEFLEYEKEQLSHLKAKYAEAKVEAEQVLPHKYIVDKAYPAERKTYPKKSIIVLQSTVSTTLLAYILLLIFLNLKIKKSKTK